MSALSFCTLPDDTLLVRLRDAPDSELWAAIVDRFGSGLAVLANRLAGDLDPDDVVSEVWCALLRTTAFGFDPCRGSAKKYLYGVCLNAIKKVRRATCGDTVSLEGENPDNGLRRSDQLAEPLDCIGSTIARLEVEMVLEAAERTASADVATALRAVYEEDLSLAEAAKKIGVNRTTLRRRIRAWWDLSPAVRCFAVR